MVWSVFHAHTQANYDIIRDLKSRVKDKRETIKGRDAYPDTIVNVQEHENYTQSNFLSLLISLSLSDFFVWWTWNLSCVNGQGQKKGVINSGKRLSRGHRWRLSIAVNATLRVDFHCCVKITREKWKAACKRKGWSVKL